MRLRESPAATAEAPSRSWLRTHWRRVGLVLLGLIATGLGLLLFGWRYGFTPLPRLRPDVTLPELPGLRWSELAPSNCWYWLGQLQVVVGQDPGVAQLYQEVQLWLNYGPAAVTNAPAINAWLADRPMIDETLQRFVTAPAIQYPTDPPRLGTPGQGSELDLSFLVHYALWRAVDPSSPGTTERTFRYLSLGWQATARSMRSRGLYGANLSGALTRASCRLLLESPALPESLVSGLAAELDRHEAALGELEDALLAGADDYLWEIASLPEWRRQGWQSAREGLGEWVQGLPDQVAGLPHVIVSFVTDPGGSHRWSGLRGPGFEAMVEGMAGAVAASVTRPQDIEQANRAVLSQYIALLRQGRRADALGYEAQLYEARGRWYRLLDRPFVHASLRFSLGRLIRREKDWQVALQAVRLTLALRRFRDTTGRWPEQWEELVPQYLEAVPVDPHTGERMGYRRSGDEYVFWATPEDRGPPTEPMLSGRTPVPYRMPVFRSAEAADARRAWAEVQQRGAATPWLADPRLLRRYGLLPPSLPPPALPPPATTP